MPKRLKRKGRKLQVSIWFLILAFLAAGAGFQPFMHCDALYDRDNVADRQDIHDILKKKRLSNREYMLLFEQTGLGRAAIDDLRKEKHGGEKNILSFQELFLSSREIRCCRSSFFTKHDKSVFKNGETAPLAPLEDGDILISFSSHTMGWKHGHAGLVVDGKKGLCLEALMPGCESKIKTVQHWRKCADFVVLRLKESSEEERKAIAAFAHQNLQDIPYSLLSGIFDRREKEDFREMTAQCAYLIWYAFMQFGYDLDGDGGRLVTIGDLLESPHLEVVQIFGSAPERIKERRKKAGI